MTLTWLRADARALGDQLAQCRVGLAVDRRRRDARVKHAVVLSNERVALRTWFESNRDIDGHQLQYAPPGPRRHRNAWIPVSAPPTTSS